MIVFSFMIVFVFMFLFMLMFMLMVILHYRDRVTRKVRLLGPQECSVGLK
jgi:hypothetical protein